VEIERPSDYPEMPTGVAIDLKTPHQPGAAAEDKSGL